MHFSFDMISSTSLQQLKFFCDKFVEPHFLQPTPSRRVAEVVRGHGGPPPKSLDSDESFKPEHTLFCPQLRFVAIYTLFGDLWAKKVFFFGSKTVFLGQEVHYYKVYIAYFTVLNL